MNSEKERGVEKEKEWDREGQRGVDRGVERDTQGQRGIEMGIKGVEWDRQGEIGQTYSGKERVRGGIKGVERMLFVRPGE